MSTRHPGFLRRPELWALVGILVLTAALRTWHLVESEANDPFFYHPSTDPKIYHDWAVSIAGGDVLGKGVFHLGPLYPYFLGGLYTLFGSSFLVGRIAQIVLGTANVLLVFLLARRVFGVRTALLSALVSAAYSMYIFIEGLLLMETLQLTLNLCLVLAVLSARSRPGAWRWFGAGTLLGLSALARPNVLLLVLILLPWLARGLRRDGVAWRTVAWHGTALCLGVGLAVAPATARNLVVGGDFVLVTDSAGVNFYIGNGPDATGAFVTPAIFENAEVDHPDDMWRTYGARAEKALGRSLGPSEVSAYWRNRALDHIRQAPGRWRALIARKLALFVNAYELPVNRDYYSSRALSQVLMLPLPGTGAILPFALVGMVLALRRLREAFPLYAMVVCYAVALALFFVLARYRIPVMPFFIVFAGFAAHRILDFVTRLNWGAIVAAAVGLAISFAVVHLDLGLAGPPPYQVHLKLGIKYRQADRDAEAVAELKKAVEADPRGLHAHIHLALIYEADPEERLLAIVHWLAARNLAMQQNDEDIARRAEVHLRRLKR